MNILSPRSLAAASVALFLILILCACAVPLAPGYHIVKESRGVEFVSGPNAELRIRAEFLALNSGTIDLDHVDMVLPNERLYGRNSLQVQLDGANVEAVPQTSESVATGSEAVRIPFSPAWSRHQTRRISVEYAFRSPQDGGTRITLGARNFHLASRGWFPQLLPPKHIFSPHPRRPDHTIYTVRVPESLVVLARGIRKAAKRAGGETEYTFELRTTDLSPYIVAGDYSESPETHKPGDAVFWTLAPLSQDSAAAAGRITSSWAVLQKDFGPLEPEMRGPHIVESSGLRNHISGEAGPAAAAFPGGALVNSEALALGIGSDEFIAVVAHALAHDWFGDQMYPAADAEIGMGEGLPEYATIVIDEALQGDAGRKNSIARYLREYDDAKQHAEEEPLGITMLTDSRDERRIALAKAPLFYIALEDACGEAQMRSGLSHMVTLLRGQEASYDSLRASLEQASGKNLAEIFRVWLNDKGIPQDFRTRYQDAAVK